MLCDFHMPNGGGMAVAHTYGRNQLGIGSDIPSSVTTPTVVSVGGYPVIGMGKEHSCAIVDTNPAPDEVTGAAYCWGYNFHDQAVGVVHLTEIPTPTLVAAADDAFHISAGDAHTCMQTATARTQCWGSDSWGQLGDSYTEANRATATYVIVPDGS